MQQIYRQFLPLAALVATTCCKSLVDAKPSHESTAQKGDSWEVYQIRNQISESILEKSLREEREANGLEKLTPAPKGSGYPKIESLTDKWFSSPEGAQLASVTRSFQSPVGGWGKNLDYASGPRQSGQNYGPEPRYIATFDNDATIPQIRLLARAYRINGNPADKEAATAGLYFILDSQYPNGGWPQIYPLAGRYHDCVTLNDGAMVNTLQLALDIANGAPDFAWLSEEDRDEIQQSLQKGIDCLLATQIEANGKKLGWAQQYDPQSLQPAPARAFEMVSLSSKESSQVIDLLIQVEDPSPEILDSIQSAVSWLEASQISGYEFRRDSDGTRKLLPREDAKPLWARFYEIDSNEALFGDRDGSIHREVESISAERRNGYAWYTTDPGSTLKRVEKWKRKREESL